MAELRYYDEHKKVIDGSLRKIKENDDEMSRIPEGAKYVSLFVSPRF